jgi:hemerythrin-like domain-containing protein
MAFVMDHREALGLAQHLRAATVRTADAALAAFDEYFRERGERHFELEERVLLPTLEAFPEGVRLASRVRDEHRWVRLLRERARGGADRVERVHDLGDVLNDHVRFEDRVVFPFLEEVLSRRELDAVARRLDAADRSAPLCP